MSSKTRLWTIAVLAFALALVIGSALARPAEDHTRTGTRRGVSAPPANIFEQPGGPNAPGSQFLEPHTPMNHT